MVVLNRSSVDNLPGVVRDQGVSEGGPHSGDETRDQIGQVWAAQTQQAHQSRVEVLWGLPLLTQQRLCKAGVGAPYPFTAPNIRARAKRH
eukprot:3929599-Pyramimonas_sp.AAC.1